MKDMARYANLPGRKTNHSGRKTTVKRLMEANYKKYRQNSNHCAQTCAKFELLLFCAK